MKKVTKKKMPRRVVQAPDYMTRRLALAELIHESGREAVKLGKVYRRDLPMKPFAEWEDLDGPTVEGRLMMAAFFLDGRRKAAIRKLLK